MGWLSKFVGIIPIIGPLLAGLSTGNAEAEKARAEAKLEEMRAFSKGRISPRFVMQYAIAGVFVLMAVAFIVALFVPDIGSHAVKEGMRELLKDGSGVLTSPGF